jgi:hypothetical protein
MPEKARLMKLKEAEYQRLVALAKRKGFKYVAPYVYQLIQMEIKRSKLTEEQLERLSKYGREFGNDYW